MNGYECVDMCMCIVSWVGRSAEQGKSNNKKTICRHCNTYFNPQKHSSRHGNKSISAINNNNSSNSKEIDADFCPVIVGKHEANIVLKDNDMRIKISLAESEFTTLADILKSDSDLLGKMEVMDYR